MADGRLTRVRLAAFGLTVEAETPGRLRRGLTGTSIPVSTVLVPTILTPVVRRHVASAFSKSGPVALANLCAARHEQGQYFRGQRVSGLAADGSAFDLMVHTDLHRSLGRSYALGRGSPVALDLPGPPSWRAFSAQRGRPSVQPRRHGLEGSGEETAAWTRR